MQEHPSDDLVPCYGCAKPTPCRRARSPILRVWCERCVVIAQDVRTIEGAGRILELYGLADASEALRVAVEGVREGLRSGTGPGEARVLARKLHLARDRERTEHLERVTTTYDRILRLIDDDEGRLWSWEAAEALADQSIECGDAELAERFRTFLRGEIARLASFCICGHRRPHSRDGGGCAKRFCRCPQGKPRSAQRIAIESLVKSKPGDADERTALDDGAEDAGPKSGVIVSLNDWRRPSP